MDLDFHDGPPEYSLDCRYRANEGRFINHSCNLNLMARFVWTEHQEPNMPTVALFAQRDIEENEELTYDYNLNRPETKKVKKRRKKGNITPQYYHHCG
ncbi:MAG: SET domain-containing protein [Gammaproteobacteria bacterium]|nr:SET domain-containing protein [Gammaproteobacteria bacterium]